MPVPAGGDWACDVDATVAVTGGLGLRERLRGVSIPLSMRDAPTPPAPVPGWDWGAGAGEMTLISPSSYILRLVLAPPVGDVGVEGEIDSAETAEVSTEGTVCSVDSWVPAREVWCGSAFFNGELWKLMGSISRSKMALDDE